jgi:hypothetical protein
MLRHCSLFLERLTTTVEALRQLCTRLLHCLIERAIVTLETTYIYRENRRKEHFILVLLLILHIKL